VVLALPLLVPNDDRVGDLLRGCAGAEVAEEMASHQAGLGHFELSLVADALHCVARTTDPGRLGRRK